MIIEPGTVTDTTGDQGWVPVTVTAILAEPVTGLAAHPCHLDGPAAWGAYLVWTGVHGHGSLPPLTAAHCTDFALPLATWTAPVQVPVSRLALGADFKVWGWACSRAHYVPEGHQTLNVRKPPETSAAARYSPDRKWDLSSGPLKARDTPFDQVLVREIRWDALADPAALRALLIRVTGIGAMWRHGHGRILKWTMQEGPPDGWRDRVMPEPGGVPGSIRAPYWHPSRRMPCTP